MQDIFGSVRRSLSLRPTAAGDTTAGTSSGSITDRIGSRLRKSRVGLGLGLGLHPKPHSPPSPITVAHTIRWRKGELIGCGAFGHVYMGLNLDSGELLAVKQVMIGSSDASKAKARDHILELEEEIKLLNNLSHPNIVRYLGTAREEDTLDILLEFVPGGSISSLLGKFGSFPEAVIRMYTKQLLLGLEYLHRNKIMHRDIKGANILVDNKGCIKLADFGASKQVAQLATITAAKSMKGTPYWMAPEVIVQSGHSFSADIWSVGCTVIEMATGKPPWSQQYQEVAALFHVGTTKSHPPIPEYLSSEAKDFLLKCLHREPNSRATAADLLQHPFVTGDYQDPHRLHCSSAVKPSGNMLPTSRLDKNSPSTMCEGADSVDYETANCSTTYSEKLRTKTMWQKSTSTDMCLWDDNDDMCQFDDNDDFPVVGPSFNPMSDSLDDWTSKFDSSPEQRTDSQNFGESTGEVKDDFRLPCEPVAEDSCEVTETKIRAFLHEKAVDLRKLQTPLFEFYNTLNANDCHVIAALCKENATNNSNLPPKSNQLPSKMVTRMTSTPHVDVVNKISTGSSCPPVSTCDLDNNRVLKEIVSPRLNESEGLLQGHQLEPNVPSVSGCDSASFYERQKKWEEELDQELARLREERRQSGLGMKPPAVFGNRKRHRSRFDSPAK